MADVWESVISDFLHGRRALPSPLDRWQASYRGGAAGKVDRRRLAGHLTSSVPEQRPLLFLELLRSQDASVAKVSKLPKLVRRGP
jgi:hypothetical protein